MYGGAVCSIIVIFKKVFEIYKMFPRCKITEFECKDDIQNHELDGYVFRISVINLLNNADKK